MPNLAKLLLGAPMANKQQALHPPPLGITAIKMRKKRRKMSLMKVQQKIILLIGRTGLFSMITKMQKISKMMKDSKLPKTKKKMITIRKSPKCLTFPSKYPVIDPKSSMPVLMVPYIPAYLQRPKKHQILAQVLLSKAHLVQHQYHY